MRWVSFCTVTLFIGPLFAPAPAAAQSSEQLFAEGVERYAEGDYAAAIEAWELLADSGIDDPDVAANLGDAYALTERYGHAIRWYERALWLRPQDATVRRSLGQVTEALGRAQAERDGEATLETRPSFTRSLVRPWSQDGLASLTLLLSALLFGLAVAWHRSRSEAGRLGLGIAVPLALASLLFVFAGFTVRADWWAEGEPAVFVEGPTPLRGAPSELAEVIRDVPEGARARLLQVDDDWCLVRLSTGAEGWAPFPRVGALRGP